MDKNVISTPDRTTYYSPRLHDELSQGDWEALYQTTADWLQQAPGQPVATFIQNIACLFVNPPAIIRNKRYLESVNDKDWKVVLGWFSGFNRETDRHNPYFQAIDFILRPPSKKKDSIETALAEHPNNAELLFLQAISLRNRSTSIEKLRQAVADKPVFPAALYLLGIFSLQLSQLEDAELYLKQVVQQSPDFLEAHYQLGSLYSLYMQDGKEKAKPHLEKVIALDPEGGAGKDARKVLEKGVQPQYGQRATGAGARRGGMGMLTIAGISLLTVALFSGPVASFLHITNPLIGILAGIFVFIGLYSVNNRKQG